MSRKSFIYAVWAVAVLGLCLSVIIAWKLPLWLDEQYSILFSWTLSPLELLYHSRDVHPGLYYVLLKVALQFTTSLPLLRILLSVVPQWVGSALLLNSWLKKSYSSKAIVLGVILIFLNPFLLFTTAQLRMYGLVALFSGLAWLLLKEWKVHRNWKSTGYLFTVLLLGNATSYSFFFLSGGVLLLMSWQYRQFAKKALATLFVGGLILLAEFVILAGVAVKHQFEEASWIPLPQLQNIPYAFWTVTGFQNDYFLNESAVSVSTVVFYFVLALVVLKFCHSIFIKKKHIIIDESLFFLVLFPGLMILAVSVLFPILSQRFFFYRFLPKLSIILPRVFLAELITGSVVLVEGAHHLLKKMITRPYRVVFVLFLGLLTIGWGMSFFRITATVNDYKLDGQNKALLIEQARTLSQSNGKPTIFLPSWIWMDGINSNSLERVNQYEKDLRQSESVEKMLLSNDFKSCGSLLGKNVVMARVESQITVQKYYQLGTSRLDECCPRGTSNEDVQSWLCP